jgi:DNA-binding NarL/FixJ family response regulator
MPQRHIVLQEIAASTGFMSATFLRFYRQDGTVPEEHQMKVFIADDSRAIIERLTDLLKEVAGVQVVGQAANVLQAIDKIDESNPDALILDLQMPGGSGLDVLRAIRPGHPALSVIICTNYPYVQFREECINAGANFFLDKSADFEKIPDILRGLIEDDMKSEPLKV